MAIISPSTDGFEALTCGEMAELECLRMLERGLPPDFQVFHHLDWHTADAACDQFGELDVCVLTPRGRIICLEIKAGPVDFSGDGITKLYADSEKDVLGQVTRQYVALKDSLRRNGLNAPVSHYLVLPNARVPSGGSLVYPRERIIDADEYRGLPGRILQHGLADQARPDAGHQKKLSDHLCGRFQVCLDVDAEEAAEADLVRRISDGLARWVPRIVSPSNVYVVDATAGSGKTQLALGLLTDAHRAGQRALYLCFNRLLADHMVRLAPAACRVETFHQLCRDVAEEHGDTVDFTRAGELERLQEAFVSMAGALSGRYDLIIVDEAQDFELAWMQALLQLGAERCRVYVLRDDDQCLYGRGGFELVGATQVRSAENFRTPRKLASMINLLHLTQEPIIARCPFPGQPPEIISYPQGEDALALACTIGALSGLLAKGYRPGQIAVLSFRGQNRSALLHQAELAGMPLRRFLGTYDTQGNAHWSEGRLLADTVYRFKGRSAPAVILTEVDFEELDEHERRKLFVGITRARRTLVLVVSERAERQLAEALEI